MSATNLFCHCVGVCAVLLCQLLICSVHRVRCQQGTEVLCQASYNNHFCAGGWSIVSATIICSVQGTGVLCQLLYSVLCRGLEYCVSYYNLFCAGDWSIVPATIICSVQGTEVLCKLL
jgi:hypothetical protein